MTSANVTQTAGIFLGAVGTKAAGNAGNAADAGFSLIMDRTSGKTDGQLQDTDSREQDAAPKTPVKVEKNGALDAAEKKAAEMKTKDDASQKAAEEKPSGDLQTSEEEPGVSEEVQEILAQAVVQVQEAIRETLGISQQELESMMTQLGLTDTDLLQADALQAIVMAAAGESDSLSILTNEALYAQLQQLTDKLGAIMQETEAQLAPLDMTADEALSQMLPQTEENAVPEQQLQPDGFLENQNFVSGGQEEPVQETDGEEIPEEMRSAQEPEEADVKETAGNKADTTEETLPEKSLSEIRAEAEHSETGQKSGGGKQENTNQFLQHDFQKTVVNALQESMAASEPAETAFTMQQAQDVLDQITEYMKLEVKQDMTELELQLQPETLGTLRIHLSAKEGAVTAQFTAENEAVKAVLEAQAVQLRENLNEQGVKVEAVEVTVASHEFNRSFAENGEGNAEYEEPKKKGTRRIRLTEEVPLEEMELSEEERIAAEMMQQNGNTVDYTA